MGKTETNSLDLEPRLAAIIAQEYPRFSDAEYARRHKLLGWALAAAGEAGLKRMLELMDVEIRTAMGLMGVTSLAQLNPSWVRPALPTGPAGVTSAYPWFEEKQ